mmetsp:Transcript_5674/g.10305  ORF Transcript_5674/g.10305 Transcript_5674/m.10305 type:complete len:93 (-) Transcript_5674:1095-1373(-)
MQSLEDKNGKRKLWAVPVASRIGSSSEAREQSDFDTSSIVAQTGSLRPYVVYRSFEGSQSCTCKVLVSTIGSAKGKHMSISLFETAVLQPGQ